MTISIAMRERVKKLLGREPRGLEDVAVVDQQGGPMVIRVASLVDDKPFPTLYWLVDPELSLQIDTAEANGLIKRMQACIDEDADLQQAMKRDHHAHIAQRERFMSSTVKARLESLGYAGVLQERGIGGIADFSRIRCLHTWYAAHLVVPNTVGNLLDQWWKTDDSIRCTAPH